MPSTPDLRARKERNANTISPPSWSPPRLDVIESGLSLALRTLRGSVLGSPHQRGIHLFVVYRGNVAVRFLRAGADDHVVLGRHESCDLHLTADPAISLRHLLARVVTLADGSTALRLTDLETPRPFVLSDGAAQRSLVATGPFAVGIGPYVVGGVPHDLDRYVEPPAGGMSGAGPYRAAPPLVESSRQLPDGALRTPAGLRRSRITLMPSSRMITHVPSFAPDGCARLTLSRASGEVSSIVLDAESLEHGVLIGRAERCLDDGLRALMTMSISRVHLMLVKDRDRTVAVDLGSTQGTYERGRRLRSADLTGRTAALTLGQYDAVQLVWQALR